MHVAEKEIHVYDCGGHKKEHIDFISIDTEGFEMEVLKNNDWRTYRPRLMCIESSHHNMTTAYDNDEVRISFEYELLPVIGKCTKGLENTINRLCGIEV